MLSDCVVFMVSQIVSSNVIIMNKHLKENFKNIMECCDIFISINCCKNITGVVKSYIIPTYVLKHWGNSIFSVKFCVHCSACNGNTGSRICMWSTWTLTAHLFYLFIFVHILTLSWSVDRSQLLAMVCFSCCRQINCVFHLKFSCTSLVVHNRGRCGTAQGSLPWGYGSHNMHKRRLTYTFP
jgi:hypothetical protein